VTNEEKYAAYNAFVSELLESGEYVAIPHCDSRILHHRLQCEYCAEATELQAKRWELGIATTGFTPLDWQIPCEADAKRPPGSESDHRRWGGNKPTSAKGDPSWPEETFASRVMYGHMDDPDWAARLERILGEPQPT